MELRSEFVHLARQEGACVAQLCRRFGISRATGHKWLARAAAGEGLANRSRRPRHSPRRTPDDIEAAVVALRDAHPFWGGRKLARRLALQGYAKAGPRAGARPLDDHRDPAPPRPPRRPAGGGGARWQRFARARPNELWQMDFKGHIATTVGRCHPLTVLDDHSRYAVCLAACADQRGSTVEQRLTAAFRRCGLPERILCDNGPPWGARPGGTAPTTPTRRSASGCSGSASASITAAPTTRRPSAKGSASTARSRPSC